MFESKNKTELHAFLSVFTLVFIAVLFIGSRNIKLRKEFLNVQNPDYIFGYDEQVKYAQKSNSNVVIIKNEEVGLWDKRKNRQNVRFVRELILGDNDVNNHLSFYQVVSVIADISGNIYVCSRFDRQIKKISKNGEFLLSIGNEGKGPGEFLTPVQMSFDTKGILWVVDWGNQRISKFHPDGKFIKSFQLQFKEPPVGFAINDSSFYLSFYDSKTGKVVHKYRMDGTLLHSFGEPVIFKKPMKYSDMTIKRNTSGGPIALFENDIWFSQRNPYEIRKFSLNGILKMQIFRKNSFMPPAKMEIIGKETYQFGIPVRSALIAIWRDKIINYITIPPYINSKYRSVIDIFDLEGNLLTSLKIVDRIWPTYYG